MINHAHWPLLTIDNNLLNFYHCGNVYQHIDSAPINFEQRSTQLELFEIDLARGRKRNISELRWVSSDHDSGFFYDFCYKQALTQGGLKIFSSNPTYFPIEGLLCSHDPENTNLITVRMNSSPHLQHRDIFHTIDCRTAHGGCEQPSILIYYNPEPDDELKVAYRESEETMEKFSSVQNSNYISRVMHSSDFFTLCSSADIIIYYGHGKIIDGYPAFRSTDGWYSFKDSNGLFINWPKKVLIYAACCDDSYQQIRSPCGTTLMPICNICDRPTHFLNDLFDTWLNGESLLAAFREASIMDARREDIRRYVYQLLGINELAVKEGLFCSKPSVNSYNFIN